MTRYVCEFVLIELISPLVTFVCQFCDVYGILHTLTRGLMLGDGLARTL